MIPQMPLIKRAAPLVISGASGIYIVLRARKLSMAVPTDESFARFLIGQPDLVTVLVGVPASWYVAQRRRRAGQPNGMAHGAKAQALHSLRQVFAALLLGIDLMARKAARLDQPELVALARRLKLVIRQGIDTLAVLGEPSPTDLEKIYGAPKTR